MYEDERRSLSLVLFGNFTTDRSESPNQVAFLKNLSMEMGVSIIVCFPYVWAFSIYSVLLRSYTFINQKTHANTCQFLQFHIYIQRH